MSDQPGGRGRRRISGTLRVLLIAAAVVVVLGLAGGIAAFWATSGAVTAADTFFAANAANGPRAAWATASPAFQTATPEAAWEAASRANRLQAYAGASWSQRSIAGGTAELTGTLKLAGGDAAPLTVSLVRGDSGWKVQTIAFSGAGVATAAPAGAQPGRIPGATLAAVCKSILAQNAHVTLDEITCPDTPATKGSVSQCPAARGAARGTVVATLEDIDSEGHGSIDCKVDLK